ncbi:hypothetical protein MPTK1_3g23180 [Marchantia polymorpha subsp. ruderalis]|uniref:Uncharacterized protein n=2 Tax=Marchantia polymorpha TaxID=3197 RepID=A0AAF6B3V6_MARPO|nr:hypothetical protein MARPO_0024s0095 [Marchantia polymorpha]BBN06690.1 hypothetical protein Mp_3g23180 [Marchantia polymorpha subsp. ruderalis]|eukprot:PTQ43589.1 hypothetical protein MARPO_0024s0095 [Marchantia polymorpha]
MYTAASYYTAASSAYRLLYRCMCRAAYEPYEWLGRVGASGSYNTVVMVLHRAWGSVHGEEEAKGGGGGGGGEKSKDDGSGRCGGRTGRGRELDQGIALKAAAAAAQRRRRIGRGSEEFLRGALLRKDHRSEGWL